MLEQNRDEFEKSNILAWHDKGYKGKGSMAVVLDSNHKPYPHTGVIDPLDDNLEDYGHKSQVAQVIREAAPESDIVVFSWFRNRKQEIIDWIKAHEAQIDVINCSFSGKVDLETFQQLKDIDIPVIVASGNDYDDEVQEIAAYDWTIAVGAWEEYREKRASYSNYGDRLDGVAYTNIYIQAPNGVMNFNGTSAAAPIVSSMIAIYNGWRRENGLPKMTREQARAFLLSNAIDKYTEGFDLESGHGLFILPPTIPALEESDEMVFKDTGTHWAKQEIDFISEKNIMNGFPDGTFQPDKVMTRAEVATVIARMMGFVKK